MRVTKIAYICKTIKYNALYKAGIRHGKGHAFVVVKVFFPEILILLEPDTLYAS